MEALATPLFSSPICSFYSVHSLHSLHSLHSFTLTFRLIALSPYRSPDRRQEGLGLADQVPAGAHAHQLSGPLQRVDRAKPRVNVEILLDLVDVALQRLFGLLWRLGRRLAQPAPAPGPPPGCPRRRLVLFGGVFLLGGGLLQTPPDLCACAAPVSGRPCDALPQRSAASLIFSREPIDLPLYSAPATFGAGRAVHSCTQRSCRAPAGFMPLYSSCKGGSAPAERRATPLTPGGAAATAASAALRTPPPPRRACRQRCRDTCPCTAPGTCHPSL